MGLAITTASNSDSFYDLSPIKERKYPVYFNWNLTPIFMLGIVVALHYALLPRDPLRNLAGQTGVQRAPALFYLPTQE
jgi:hypothetical protein